MLKEELNGILSKLKESEDFYTRKTDEDPITNSTSWDVNYRPNLPGLYKDINDIIYKLEKLQKRFQTFESESILKLAKSLRNRFSRLAKKHSELKEDSSTSQGGASMDSGGGSQYATPKAFSKSKSKPTSKNMYKSTDWRKVPPKIKGSGLEVKKLYESEYNEFQKGRIDIFDNIEEQLNDLSPLISNAKNKTIDYYSNNPGSYAIVNSTDLILEYIKDIKTLLNGE